MNRLVFPSDFPEGEQDAFEFCDWCGEDKIEYNARHPLEATSFSLCAKCAKELKKIGWYIITKVEI